MIITLIAVGKNMPAWVETGMQEYTARMPQDYKINLIEIPLEKRAKNADLAKITQIEEAKIKQVIPSQSLCIPLDRIGKMLDTLSLANHLQTWHDNRQDISLVIGGPEGLSEAFLKTATTVWSLSALTLPHPLVRVVVAEQLYRAWSITVNHPYHR